VTKKAVIILGLFVGLIVVTIIYLSQSQTKTVSPLGNQKMASRPTGEKLETYYNDCGFEFHYPQSAKVVENEINDQSTYANLLISSGKNSGSITLLVTDTDYETIKEYLDDEKIATGQAKVSDLKLVDVEAKKIVFKDRETVLAIDQGVLFKFEIDYQTAKDYWQQAENTIVKSFAFIAPTQDQTTIDQSGGGELDIIDEGEEIIE